jgi:hypothetical protein
VGPRQDLAVHGVQQGALVLEVPVEGRLAHAQALGDQAGRQGVHPDLVQELQRRLQDAPPIDLHLAPSGISSLPKPHMNRLDRAANPDFIADKELYR